MEEGEGAVIMKMMEAAKGNKHDRLCKGGKRRGPAHGHGGTVLGERSRWAGAAAVLIQRRRAEAAAAAESTPANPLRLDERCRWSSARLHLGRSSTTAGDELVRPITARVLVGRLYKPPTSNSRSRQLSSAGSFKKNPACSSSSSSSSPALFAAAWFPSSLKEEAISLSVRGLTYPGHVILVEPGKPLWSMVHFKTAKTSRARFSVGDQAKLESKNRRSWSGDVTVVEDDVIQLWTILQIRVPSARERKIVLKPSNNVPVMVNPAGFSQVGRILVEMGLRSIDVQVVAINDPSMTLDRMVEIWKSTNIRIAKKDHQTSVFEKRLRSLTRMKAGTVA
uniref:Uncharacterized protein n=1 Tax=Setaria viridis TaxID=4556 RepID=A0A4U6UDB4_SETVI|nr:hypothetical protein SEVIR_5G081100v2 [Setaria viridis]